jgi:hypothetical protein
MSFFTAWEGKDKDKCRESRGKEKGKRKEIQIVQNGN